MTTSVVPPEVDPPGAEDGPPTPAGASPGPDDGRRFAAACAVGGALAMVVLAWLATRGFATLFDRPELGDFFDAQARALFHGRWEMPPGVLRFERFDVDGRYYTYFGPTPALLRMPLLLVTDGLDGRLSRVAVIAACAVTVWAVARLSWLARRTVRGDDPLTRGERVVAAGVVVVAALGTVVPYLAGWTAVYHEAIVWGVAFALVSYAALVGWMLDGRSRDLVIAGGAAALAVLARGSVGFGPVAAIALAAAVRVVAAVRERRAGRRPQWGLLGGLAAAVLVPIALYGYVNAAKFGSAFGAPPWGKQDVLVSGLSTRRRAMAANGGSLLGLRYAPTILFHYFRPDGIVLDRLFPFSLMPTPTRVFGDTVFEALRPSMSITSASPLPLLAAALGTVVTFVRAGLRRVWLVPVLGSAVGAAGAVSLAFVDERYLGDFVPLLVVPGVVGAWVAVDWLKGRSRPLVVSVAVAVVLLGLWSAWANFAAAFVYQRAQSLSATVADRASLVKAQLGVQDLLGGLPSRVAAGDALPEDGQAGDLFVLGDCAGVYRHDGALWQPAELTPSTGASRVRVRLGPDATGPQPVLSSRDERGTTVLRARRLGDDRVSFDYEFTPATTAGDLRHRSLHLGTVRPSDDGAIDLAVDVDRDVFTTRLQVRADDHLLRDVEITDPASPFELGGRSGSESATDAVRVRALPVATPLCDRLVRMGLDLPAS